MAQNIHYIKKQTTIQLIANFIIGGVIAYFMTKELPQVNLWLDTNNIAQTNIAVDLIMGSFFMALILSLVYSMLTKSAKNKGEFSLQTSHKLLAKLPNNFLKRALFVGGLFLFSFGFFAIAMFSLMGIEGLSPTAFVFLKAVLSGIEAALVTFIIIHKELSH
ncbi:hypothetical protein [Thalassotalea hakodatensis]|uniref:hypothetical protein n=1 Tax=Thalassotalea hakodatensis TaxID=3030492 RepID=UPI00257382A8|nr:hypothetical protein [Thalassotalea hakodatensis]